MPQPEVHLQLRRISRRFPRDTTIDINKERAEKLYNVVETLRPNIIMNNRLGGGYQGDVTPKRLNNTSRRRVIQFAVETFA